MPVLLFNCGEFRMLYPQFADFEDDLLGHLFEQACLFLDNSEASAVPYNPPQVLTRKTLIYLLICHLCELTARGNAMVGNIDKAAQGSVSVSLARAANPGATWFEQTQCGATAWQLLKAYGLGGRLYK